MRQKETRTVLDSNTAVEIIFPLKHVKLKFNKKMNQLYYRLINKKLLQRNLKRP